MSNEVSRRGFIQGAGATAIATSVMSAGMAFADEDANATIQETYDIFTESRVVMDDIAPEEIEATYDYDVVVIGAGTAGTTAAFCAADKGGVKVAVLQNAATSISQGNMGSGLIKSESTEWGLRRFVHEWMKNNMWASDAFMVENYVNYSGDAVEMIKALAEEAGFPEQNTMVSDDIKEWDNGEKICSRRLLFIDKPITWGDAMAAISSIGSAHNVDYYFECPGVKLIQDESGAIKGCYGLNENTGKYIQFNTSIGVILATGSFVNNQAMLQRYCTQALGYTCKVSGRYGDGHLMGLLAGGTMRNGAYTKMTHDNDAGPFQDVPFLAVNYAGERFINEQVDSTLWCNFDRDQEVCGRFFSIFDSNAFEQGAAFGGRPVTPESIQAYMPGTEAANAKGAYGFFVATYMADTIEELAEQLGLPADKLVETVDHYNDIVASGIDTDFGKDSDYLFPVINPPFYGVNRWSRLSTILQGLEINKYQQVLDASKQPIPGLYAAGNCSGVPGGQSDWVQVSLGESLGFAFTDGYVAGCAIVNALE